MTTAQETAHTDREGNQPGAVVEAFRRYSRAFQSLDPRAVVPFFNEPAMLITPQGIVAMSSSAEVEQTYRRVMVDLPARGYASTELLRLAERRLSNDLTVVTGEGIWRNASGEELSRFGMTYTMRRLPQESWRIVTAVIHDP